MKKIIVLTLLLAMLLTACAPNETNDNQNSDVSEVSAVSDEKQPTGEKPLSLTNRRTYPFPMYNEITEENQAVFNAPYFEFTISTPDNWGGGKANRPSKYPVKGAWSPIEINRYEKWLTDGPVHIGCFGFNIYEGESASPKEIYKDLAADSDYFFDLTPISEGGEYQEIARTDNTVTAITKTNISEKLAKELGYEGGAPVRNYAILCHNSDLKVYVAVEIDSAELTEKQLIQLAETITLNDGGMSALYKDYIKSYYTVIDGEQKDIPKIIPRYVENGEFEKSDMFYEALKTIDRKGLVDISCINSPDLNKYLCHQVMMAIRRENQHAVLPCEEWNEKISAYPKIDSFFGKSDAGYYKKETVERYVELSYGEDLKDTIMDGLSYYFCEQENVYSIPWHIVEVSNLPIIYSFTETQNGCEIVFGTASYMDADDKAPIGFNDASDYAGGEFQLIKRDDGFYEAVPVFKDGYLDMLDNKLYVKFIKSKTGLAIDEITMLGK